MDSKYQVPYRKGICRDQQNIQSSTGTIRSLLSKAVIISICADIWSKPVMTSFLDVTAHFFTRKSNKRHSYLHSTNISIPTHWCEDS